MLLLPYFYGTGLKEKGTAVIVMLASILLLHMQLDTETFTSSHVSASVAGVVQCLPVLMQLL